MKMHFCYMFIFLQGYFAAKANSRIPNFLNHKDAFKQSFHMFLAYFMVIIRYSRVVIKSEDLGFSRGGRFFALFE